MRKPDQKILNKSEEMSNSRRLLFRLIKTKLKTASSEKSERQINQNRVEKMRKPAIIASGKHEEAGGNTWHKSFNPDVYV